MNLTKNDLCGLTIGLMNKNRDIDKGKRMDRLRSMALEMPQILAQNRKWTVPQQENALDKTMEVEMQVEDSCISAINLLRDKASDPFEMKSAISAIDDSMKKVKKQNSKIISKWNISTKKVDDIDYIYVDVDYKTTLRTHRHIIQLTPWNFVENAAFYDDTTIESLPKPPKTEFEYPEFKYRGAMEI